MDNSRILDYLTDEERALLAEVAHIPRPNLSPQKEKEFNLGVQMGMLPPK